MQLQRYKMYYTTLNISINDILCTQGKRGKIDNANTNITKLANAKTKSSNKAQLEKKFENKTVQYIRYLLTYFLAALPVAVADDAFDDFSVVVAAAGSLVLGGTSGCNGRSSHGKTSRTYPLGLGCCNLRRLFT